MSILLNQAQDGYASETALGHEKIGENARAT
jgi:hypothetical protein